MLIAIDIGNTNIVIGLYKGTTLKDHFRVSSRSDLTADEASFFVTAWLERMNLTNEQIDAVIICSVVPTLTRTFETVGRKHLGCMPTVVSHRLQLPITIEIDQPDQVGADRIANATAGFIKFGGPLIVVDFGTATTFDVVNEKGAYIGGVIIQESTPSLRGRFGLSDHIFVHRGFDNDMAQQEQFGQDPRSAPRWVFPGHSADECADLTVNLGSAWGLPGLPSPVEAKSQAMPADDSLGLNDQQSRSPSAPELRQ